jgi:hypothetical protein
VRWRAHHLVVSSKFLLDAGRRAAAGRSRCTSRCSRRRVRAVALVVRFASRRWGSGSARRRHRAHAAVLRPRVGSRRSGSVRSPRRWPSVGRGRARLPLVGNTEGIDELTADRTYVVSLVITAVIAAPIVEEMVFRGVVMRGLRSRLAMVPSSWSQGLLFGARSRRPGSRGGQHRPRAGALGRRHRLRCGRCAARSDRAVDRGPCDLQRSGAADGADRCCRSARQRRQPESANRSALSIRRTSPNRTARAMRYGPGGSVVEAVERAAGLSCRTPRRSRASASGSQRARAWPHRSHRRSSRARRAAVASARRSPRDAHRGSFAGSAQPLVAARQCETVGSRTVGDGPRSRRRDRDRRSSAGRSPAAGSPSRRRRRRRARRLRTAWSTTVVTPSKWPGGCALHRRRPAPARGRWSRSRSGTSRRGRHVDDVDAEPRRTRAGRRRVGVGSDRSRPVAELERIDEDRDDRPVGELRGVSIRSRWPRWSAPIVGTSAMVRRIAGWLATTHEPDRAPGDLGGHAATLTSGSRPRQDHVRADGHRSA